MNNEQMQKLRNKVKKKLTPLTAIRHYCKENCCVGDLISWKECTLDYCFLYSFRFGKKNVSQSKKQNKKPLVLPLSSDKLEPSEVQETL